MQMLCGTHPRAADIGKKAAGAIAPPINTRYRRKLPKYARTGKA